MSVELIWSEAIAHSHYELLPHEWESINAAENESFICALNIEPSKYSLDSNIAFLRGVTSKHEARKFQLSLLDH